MKPWLTHPTTKFISASAHLNSRADPEWFCCGKRQHICQGKPQTISSVARGNTSDNLIFLAKRNSYTQTNANCEINLNHSQLKMHPFSGGDKIWGEESFDEPSSWQRSHLWGQVNGKSPPQLKMNIFELSFFFQRMSQICLLCYVLWGCRRPG